MGHADDDFLDADISGGAQHTFDAGDHAFAAIQAETFGAGMFDLEEVFEAFRLDQILVDHFLQAWRKFGTVVVAFNGILNP